MPTTKIVKYFVQTWSDLLFLMVVFFTSCCFIDSKGFPYFFTKFTYFWLKVALAVILPFIATLIDYAHHKDLVRIGNKNAFMIAVFILAYIIDGLTLRITWRITMTHTIYHLFYGACTFFSVWLCCLLITTINQRRGKLNNNFSKMHRTFVASFAWLVLLMFIMVYFVMRDYGKEVTANFVLFKGAFRNLIKFRLVDDILRLVGNLLFFSALSMLLLEFAKKNKVLWGIAVPTLLSIAMETFQYITACGDTDVDDIVANALGAIAGYLVHRLIIEKIKEKELC